MEIEILWSLRCPLANVSGFTNRESVKKVLTKTKSAAFNAQYE